MYLLECSTSWGSKISRCSKSRKANLRSYEAIQNLEEFEGAHAAYHEQLKNDRDIDGSDAYFVEVKRGIEDITGDVTG